MVSGAIPAFRLTNKAFIKDTELLEKMGIKIHYNIKIDRENFTQIKNSNDFVYIAAGAQRSKKFEINGIEAEGILDPLPFLFDIKRGKKVDVGNKVVIIGGGNTAMDAARTAWRLVGQNGNVTIIYRRTIREMPADSGEINAVREEGVEIIELALPVKINEENGKVRSITCIRMKQGLPDASGRPKPVPVPGSEFEIFCDTVIPAIGQETDFDFIDKELLETVPGVYETKIPGVFIGGDALRGASTAINAIGDGRKAAAKIIEKAGVNFEIPLARLRNPKTLAEHMTSRMIKRFPGHTHEIEPGDRKNFSLVTGTFTSMEAIEEASRCLLCDEVCNICVTVCPNLANYSYEINPTKYCLNKITHQNGKQEIIQDELFEVNQKYQILHIADWCNECGNCTTFCPTAGSPYKNKPHLYLSRKAFEQDDDCYFLVNKNGDSELIYKEKGITHHLTEQENAYLYYVDGISISIDKKTFEIIRLETGAETRDFRLHKAAEMSIVLQGAKKIYNTIN